MVEAIAGRRPEAARPPERIEAAHAAFRAWSDPAAATPGASDRVDLAVVVSHLTSVLPPQTIFTNGAGNYATWAHRFYPHRDFEAQVAPTSGSMGYGLPAAIAAALRRPDRPVVCFAGDGCFQMTSQEFATAAAVGARLVVLVCDNGLYGTIRLHQAKRYPGRRSATALSNPDFAALARAHGRFGERVETSAAFPDAFARAQEAAQDGPALLHLMTDPDLITPSARLSSMETNAGS